MTVRALILGFLGAAIVCAATYFNDAVIHQTFLVGNNMPVSVYGSLVIFLLLVNPVLRRISPGAPLRGTELAVILAMTLAACAVPGSGLMRSFPSSLVLPHHFARVEVGWQDQGVLDLAPDRMLVDAGGDEGGRVVNGFIQGLGVGERHIGFFDVPWAAWWRPLAFWLPTILALWIALLGLSLVVHRQWSQHEQLSYPIAQFVNSLLPEPGEARGGVFRSRLFWIGLLAVLVIHLNNYAATWFPAYMVQIPLGFDFNALRTIFPTLSRGGGWLIFAPRFYFTVVAFSFFLAADVSFSLGIGPILFAYVSGLLLGAGVSLAGGGYLSLKPQTFLNFGAYFGLFLGLVYTGRHYYAAVFRRAVFRKGGQAVEGFAAWGARVFLVCFLAFAASLVAVGLDWQLAVLYGLGVVIIFLVMSRILAETGLFFLQPYTFPCVVLWGLFGARALGPGAMLTLLMLTSVLLIDPRESLMPFVVNSLKMVDLRKGPLGRVGVACTAAVLLGLAVAVPVQFFFQYDQGTNLSDSWANDAVPKMPFEETVRIQQRLEAQDSLEEASSVSGWARFARMSPDPALLLAFGAGVVLVTVFTACRLRFPKWPLHPVMFLVWNSYPGQAFAASFLAGCFVKWVVTKYGGPAAYRKLKPLMFGVIAGEMLGGIIPGILGAVYYQWMDKVPQAFSIMPG